MAELILIGRLLSTGKAASFLGISGGSVTKYLQSGQENYLRININFHYIITRILYYIIYKDLIMCL